MGEMLDFTTTFDSEDSAVSSTRPGNLLVDIYAILTVSDTSVDPGVCRITLSGSVKSDDEGRALSRWVLVRARFDEIRSLLATKRVVLPALGSGNFRLSAPPSDTHPAPTVESAVEPQYITVHDGMYCEQTLSLPRHMVPTFTVGYKFHIDSTYRICPSWLSNNVHRNYILEFVEYDGNEASTCMTSERSLSEAEERMIAGRMREKAVAHAKGLIKSGRGAVDMLALEASIQEEQSRLTPEALEAFRKYVSNIPSRLGPCVGDHMIGGKTFEEAVERGSAYLISATHKKLATMLQNGKNRRVP